MKTTFINKSEIMFLAWKIIRNKNISLARTFSQALKLAWNICKKGSISFVDGLVRFTSKEISKVQLCIETTRKRNTIEFSNDDRTMKLFLYEVSSF